MTKMFHAQEYLGPVNHLSLSLQLLDDAPLQQILHFPCSQECSYCSDWSLTWEIRNSWFMYVRICMCRMCIYIYTHVHTVQ